jgi:hypothetical protein
MRVSALQEMFDDSIFEYSNTAVFVYCTRRRIDALVSPTRSLLSFS